MASIMRNFGMQLANLTGKSTASYSALTLYQYTIELQYGPTGLPYGTRWGREQAARIYTHDL
jgi:hypothetical protein